MYVLGPGKYNPGQGKYSPRSGICRVGRYTPTGTSRGHCLRRLFVTEFWSKSDFLNKNDRKCNFLSNFESEEAARGSQGPRGHRGGTEGPKCIKNMKRSSETGGEHFPRQNPHAVGGHPCDTYLTPLEPFSVKHG